jgi:C-terminal processing protease CtpA/Prc
VGVRKIGDVWMVTIPTFDFQTDVQLAQIKAFIDTLNAKAPELRKGIVVFDVRGNRGGNTTWASEILATLWDKEWIDRRHRRTSPQWSVTLRRPKPTALRTMPTTMRGVQQGCASRWRTANPMGAPSSR